MPERVRAVAERLPNPLAGWLERSHQRYRGVLSHRSQRGRGDAAATGFDDGGIALPPADLRRLVSLDDDLDAWLRSGEQDAGLIRELVESNRGPLTDLGAILDFGCGCGRVARWWAGLEGSELSGCDYDGRLTAWCQANLPFLRVKTNASRPPLPFGREAFDLVYAISLFTHMTEEAQDRWLGEVRRLLKPGGLLLFTVHGERFLGHLTGQQRDAFAAGRHVVSSPELNGMEGCAAFHPPRYVSERLLPPAGLELVDVVRESRSTSGVASPLSLQDTYLARRP